MVASAMMARELEPGLRELLAQRRAGAGEAWYRSVSVGSDDGVLYARVYVSEPDPGGEVVVRVFEWGLPYTFSDQPAGGVRDRGEPAPPWGQVGRDPDGFGVRIARQLCALVGGRELDPARVEELLSAGRSGPPDEHHDGWRGFVHRLRTGGSRGSARRPVSISEDTEHGVFAVALNATAGSAPAEDGAAETR